VGTGPKAALKFFEDIITQRNDAGFAINEKISGRVKNKPPLGRRCWAGPPGLFCVCGAAVTRPACWDKRKMSTRDRTRNAQSVRGYTIFLPRASG
jgi:hypothetical protein